jgi:hypothetical protein
MALPFINLAPSTAESTGETFVSFDIIHTYQSTKANENLQLDFCGKEAAI